MSDPSVPEEAQIEIDDFIDEDRTLTQEIKYKITTYGADFLVDGLADRFEKEEIYIPDFQRSFVWTRPQASRFIESLLLGLPTPGIFLYRETETNKFLIVDGLQRLTSIAAFLSGKLPGSDRVFRLEKVNTSYVGRSFEELDPEDQRQIKNTIIHATIFQQTDPPEEEGEKNSVYLVFERLNTGGTPLQPQEIRSALYHGPFVEFLEELNGDKNWRKVFGSKSKRRKDEELILRHLAFLHDFESYEPPMVRFLNRYMSKNRKMKHVDVKVVREHFSKTFDFIVSALGEKAFRPKRNLNAAVFDSVSTTVARHKLYDHIDPEDFRKKYESLVQDEDYSSATSRSTSDDAVVKRRFSKADEYLSL